MALNLLGVFAVGASAVALLAPLSFETLHHGYARFGFGDPEYLVVQDEAELQDVYVRYLETTTVPTVDFENDMVILAFGGLVGWDHAYRVRSIDVTEAGDERLVRVTVTSWHPWAIFQDGNLHIVVTDRVPALVTFHEDVAGAPLAVDRAT